MKARIEKILNAVKGKENNDIVIIGKGSSIDQIDVSLLSNNIIININDSERILPGDIGVFHHGWVMDYLEKNAPACNLYVTDRWLPPSINRLEARYAPYTEKNYFVNERFFDSDTIWLESAAILNCLRVANEIAKATGQKKRVYLLGFDFSIEQGFSKKIEDSTHGVDEAFIEHSVKSQEKYLESLLNERDKLNVEIYHIGDRPFSHYTVAAFNALFSSFQKEKYLTEGVVKNDVLIVAEITTNHFGDKNRLEAMIRLAKQAGADYIKLQKRDVETFYDKETLDKPFTSPFGTTFREYRHGIELSEEDFYWVEDLCKDLGIGWFASVLDEPSFEFMKKLNPEFIKLPSTISNKKSYLENVGNNWTGGLVISTGMTEPEYEDFIKESFKKASSIYLLQCTSSYPTAERDAGIGVVRHYRDLSKEDPRIIPGFSSHDIGALCSQMAVAAGAKMIEKHVKLGKVQWAHFDEVAVDLATGDFARFVKEIRRAELIVGSETKSVLGSEHHKY